MRIPIFAELSNYNHARLVHYRDRFVWHPYSTLGGGICLGVCCMGYGCVAGSSTVPQIKSPSVATIISVAIKDENLARAYELLQSIRRRFGEIRPRHWRYYCASAEALRLQFGFRSDSVVSIVHANRAPDFTAVENMGILFRPFTPDSGQ